MCKPDSRSHVLLKIVLAMLLMQGCERVVAVPLPVCSRTFTLAYHQHGMLYEKDSNTGIDKDVAQELMRRSGCKFEISVMPRSRIWAWIESGELDFSMSGITNAERDRFAGFAWYLCNKYYLLVRKDSGVKSLPAFEADPALSIGAIRSFRYSPALNRFVDRLTSRKRVTEVPDHAQLLGMISLNRIQGMIIEPFNYSQVDRQALQKMTRIIETEDPPTLHGLIMSKKSLPAAERKKWAAIIDGMHKDGTIYRILRKYFDRKMAQSMVDF